MNNRLSFDAFLKMHAESGVSILWLKYIQHVSKPLEDKVEEGFFVYEAFTCDLIVTTQIDSGDRSFRFDEILEWREIKPTVIISFLNSQVQRITESTEDVRWLLQ